MRSFIACLAVVVAVMMLGSAVAPVTLAAAHSGYSLSAAADQQPAQGKLDINIDVNKGGGGGNWWQNPVWMAIGGIALVLLILVVVMMARGGGTTVVKG
jgi:hypothetical protein